MKTYRAVATDNDTNTTPNITTEEWRVCTGHESYEVSNSGRVRNRRTGRVLKQSLSNNASMPTVYLHNPGAKSSKEHVTVAELVATAFVPNPDPDSYTKIGYHDNDYANMRASNLYWMTPALKYSQATATHRGELHHSAKLTTPQVREILRRWRTGKYFQRQLAEEFGVSRWSIGQIVTGKRWKHVSRKPVALKSTPLLKSTVGELF